MMEIKDIAALIVPIATALGILIPVLKSTLDNRKIFEKELHLFGIRLDSFEKKLDLNSRDIQRLTMHDEHLPLEERIQAGKRYIDLGGNGSSQAYYSILVQEYEKILTERKNHDSNGIYH